MIKLIQMLQLCWNIPMLLMSIHICMFDRWSRIIVWHPYYSFRRFIGRIFEDKICVSGVVIKWRIYHSIVPTAFSLSFYQLFCLFCIFLFLLSRYRLRHNGIERTKRSFSLSLVDIQLIHSKKWMNEQTNERVWYVMKHFKSMIYNQIFMKNAPTKTVKTDSFFKSQKKVFKRDERREIMREISLF